MILVWALLAVGGSVACFIYFIRFLVVTFRTSIGWGLACLLIPPVALAFGATHWEAAKWPLVHVLATWAIFCLGGILLASSVGH
jgi:hypothetical protein